MRIVKKDKLFPFLSPLLPENPVIVEAGTFNGKDTLLIARQWPKSTIHAFEPVPEIFSLLQKNTAHLPNIHRYCYALSNASGTAQFYLAEQPKKPGLPCPAGSLREPRDRLNFSPITYPKTTTVTTITLDAWAEQHNITYVDLLWLDVQGHALTILQASPQILSTLKVLHVEVEFNEAYKGQASFDEVKMWLETQRFEEVARDFEDQTSWFFGNAVFVKK
jgi:FkbM family methyltransferase